MEGIKIRATAKLNKKWALAICLGSSEDVIMTIFSNPDKKGKIIMAPHTFKAKCDMETCLPMSVVFKDTISGKAQPPIFAPMTSGSACVSGRMPVCDMESKIPKKAAELCIDAVTMAAHISAIKG